MKYRNPVIPGFNPDPSICRVGRDYYVAVSSFILFPGIPIYHSVDLVNWELTGHCLTKPSQLPLEGVDVKHGVWAPSLRFHEGVFHVTATFMTSCGPRNFIVSAADPSDAWSEPIFVAQSGIDPDIFFEDDGSAYYLTNSFPNPCGGISASRIEPGTWKLLSEPQPLWGGTGGAWPEGAHLYKRGGFHYLMIAEGGTHSGHMETIARSKTLFGPYESCPHNPVLTHRNNALNPIQCTGHADLLEAHDGSWWMIHLGVRKAFDIYVKHFLGRETFLVPISWDADGWPSVNGGTGMTALEMEGPSFASSLQESLSFKDTFNRPELGREWSFLRNPKSDAYDLKSQPGCLRLHASAKGLEDEISSPSFACIKQRQFEFQASAILNCSPVNPGDEAGLAVYMSPGAHYLLSVGFPEGRRQVYVRHCLDGLSGTTASHPLESGIVELELSGDTRNYYFRFRQGNGPWTHLGAASTRFLCAEVVETFSGVVLGVFAKGGGSFHADFGSFSYQDAPSAQSSLERPPVGLSSSELPAIQIDKT